MRNPDAIFASLGGNPFFGCQWAPKVRRTAGGDDDDATLPNSHYERQLASDIDLALAEERGLRLAEKTLDDAERAGLGEGPSQLIDRKKLQSLLAELGLATDLAEIKRLAAEVNKLLATTKPNAIRAARAKLRAATGADERIQSPLVRDAERRAAAARRPRGGLAIRFDG